MKIYISMMGVLSDNAMSGSDKVIIEKVKRWKFDEVNFIVPPVGKSLLLRYLKNVNYIVVNDNKSKNVVLCYLSRLYNSYKKFRDFKLDDDSVLYSSCDGLFDVIPCYLLKKRNPKVKWFVAFHMIAPNPFKGHEKAFLKGYKIPSLNNTFNFIAQRIGLFFTLRNSDYIFAINRGIVNLLLKNGYPSSGITLVGNGVEVKDIIKIKSMKKKYDACFVGRFHMQKGIFDLVQITKNLVKHRPDFKLAVVGMGDLEDKLKFKIKQFGLEKNVDILGFLDGEDKFKVVKSSRFLFFPSTYESWGIVACEAMACGLPVIAYDLPVYRGIFDKGMIKVRIGDVSSFSKVALGLLNDSKKYVRYSKLAFEQARDYDWDRVARIEFDVIKHYNDY